MSVHILASRTAKPEAAPGEVNFIRNRVTVGAGLPDSRSDEENAQDGRCQVEECGTCEWQAPNKNGPTKFEGGFRGQELRDFRSSLKVLNQTATAELIECNRPRGPPIVRPR